MLAHCSTSLQQKTQRSPLAPFPTLPVFALGSAFLPLTLHLWRCLSAFPQANVTCSVTRSFLNQISQTQGSVLGDGIDYSDKQKERNRKGGRGDKPFYLDIYLTTHEKAAKPKYLSISKAWWDNALVLALVTCELDVQAITLVLLRSPQVHLHCHVQAHFIKTKPLLKRWEYNSAAVRSVLQHCSFQFPALTNVCLHLLNELPQNFTDNLKSRQSKKLITVCGYIVEEMDYKLTLKFIICLTSSEIAKGL